MEIFSLKGKKAMVTGAGGSIGFAIAEGFVKAGASVAFIDYAPNIHNVAKSADPTGERAFGVVGDLTKIEALSEIYNEALEKLGGQVDILVNCAGVALRGDCETYPLDLWKKTMSLNVDAVFFLSQLASKAMIKQGKGKIINVSSILSILGSGGSPAYSTSKGAVIQMTKSMAIGWGRMGINVNAMAPGWLESPLSEGVRSDPERVKTINNRLPIDRWAFPIDMVGPAIFLASDASDYVNGTTLVIDGGYTVC